MTASAARDFSAMDEIFTFLQRFFFMKDEVFQVSQLRLGKEEAEYDGDRLPATAIDTSPTAHLGHLTVARRKGRKATAHLVQMRERADLQAADGPRAREDGFFEGVVFNRTSGTYMEIVDQGQYPAGRVGMDEMAATYGLTTAQLKEVGIIPRNCCAIAATVGAALGAGLLTVEPLGAIIRIQRAMRRSLLRRRLARPRILFRLGPAAGGD